MSLHCCETHCCSVHLELCGLIIDIVFYCRDTKHREHIVIKVSLLFSGITCNDTKKKNKMWEMFTLTLLSLPVV